MSDSFGGYQRLASSSQSNEDSVSNDLSSNSGVNSELSVNHFVNLNMDEYDKVIFSGINESYPTDADIQCHFYLDIKTEKSPQDRIGLFKVGWKNVNQAVVFKSVSYDGESNAHDFGEQVIQFKCSDLPKDKDQFYQFVFVGKNDEIYGASIPFCFYRPFDEDLIQLEKAMNSFPSDASGDGNANGTAVGHAAGDRSPKSSGDSDEEFVVVRSQQALLQERIQHLVNANGVLEYSKRGLEQQLGTVSKELDLVKKINCELENQIVNYGKEVQQLSDLIKEKDNEIQQVIDKLKDVESRNSNLEQQLFKRDSDLQTMNSQMKQQDQLSNEYKSKLSLIEAEMECQQATMAKVLSERRDLEHENKLLRNELDDYKAKCESMEQSKDLMMKEILDLEKLKLKSKVELKVAAENHQQFEDQLKVAIEERENFKIEKDGMEKKVSEMKSRLANAALKYDEIYKRNFKLENKMDKIKNKIMKINENKSKGKSEANAVLYQELLDEIKESKIQDSKKEIQETQVKKLIDSQSQTSSQNNFGSNIRNVIPTQPQTGTEAGATQRFAPQAQSVGSQPQGAGDQHLIYQQFFPGSNNHMFDLAKMLAPGKENQIVNNGLQQSQGPWVQTLGGTQPPFGVPPFGIASPNGCVVTPSTNTNTYYHRLPVEEQITVPKSGIQNFTSPSISHQDNGGSIVFDFGPQSNSVLYKPSEGTIVPGAVGGEAVAGAEAVVPGADGGIVSGAYTLPCQICNEDIRYDSGDTQLFVKHLEDKHNQRMCPVCSMMFDMNLRGAEQYYAWHVENHFDSNIPQPPEPIMNP